MTKLPNKALVNALQKSLTGEIAFFEDYYVSYISNREFPTRVQFSPIYDNKVVVGGIGIIEDLTNQKEMMNNLEILRQKDILTNLLNRASFDEFIFSTEIDIYYPITIATYDINTFQVINTSFGYEVGNQVLIEIANVFKDCTSNQNNLRAYRIGGDEFALLMLNISEDEAKDIVTKTINMFSNINVFDFNISISYGISSTSDNNLTVIETFNNSLADMAKNKIYDGSSISVKTIDVIMSTLFEKSNRESLHSERVSLLSRKIADAFNLGTAFSNRTELAGKLHDIGKINISEEILNKPGKLSNLEWVKIKKHSETGFKILSSVPEYLELAGIVYSHHERWDGTGYPRGLKKNLIPLEARIIGVADAYDAMTKDRTYRDALTKREAIEELTKYSGTQFDPNVIDIFIRDVLKNKF